MDSILHKLMCLSIISSAAFYINNQFKDKDIVWFGEGDKIGHLIATAEIPNGMLYFIDTDGYRTTAEYVATNQIGCRSEVQMSAQLFNNEQRTITQMPLKKWREFSTQFQRVDKQMD